MKNFIFEFLSPILNSLSQNETFNRLLMSSVKIIDLFSYKNFGIYFFFTSIFLSILLLFYIKKQIKSCNYIYSIFLIIPLFMSFVSWAITGWTIHSDMNNHIVSETKIPVPEKINKLQSSTYYYVNDNIYAVNNECQLDITKPLTIYKTSRNNQYIEHAFNEKCVYTLISKEYGEGL
jgi:hypothetical protein